MAVWFPTQLQVALGFWRVCSFLLASVWQLAWELERFLIGKQVEVVSALMSKAKRCWKNWHTA